jgi:uncharacterized protein (TIGR01777 family)
MKFVLAGASGFLGAAWRDHLAQQGHDVVRLVRGEKASPHESHWDPYAGIVDQELIEGTDLVANLAGAPIGHWPWTTAYRKTLHDSRVATTSTLANAIARAESKPVFLAQNGVSGYGDRGDEVLTEASSANATTVLGKVTRAWADATTPASEAGARVCIMCTAVVLDKRGGALQPMLLQFKAGLGGPIGSGRQYFPTISLGDWLRAATFLATVDGCRGVYNLSGPNTTTNAEFSRELARMVHRPAILRAPARPMRLVLGGLADELLGSVRVEPARLQEAGFEFGQASLNTRLAAALT